jgi:predicted PurR-regulated permease PerM
MVGIIISVPLVAALNVVFSHGLKEYKSSSFYNS